MCFKCERVVGSFSRMLRCSIVVKTAILFSRLREHSINTIQNKDSAAQAGDTSRPY